MAQEVVNGAMTMCTMGAGPSSLVVAPLSKVLAGNMPAANIMDNKPTNIIPFPLCLSQANPLVAAATAAALGAPTPAACVPVVPAPWSPGSSTVMIANMPALSSTSKATCVYGGSISIAVPGQFTVNVP